MTDALIGYSGFVGGTLLRQRAFEARYRSTNIGSIAGGEFELVVCAGAPAQKWIANRDPEADRLKAEIETAGWRVVDRGPDFSLVPAHPADVSEGGFRRYR